MTLDELRQHRNEILELAGNSGATNVRVFGSLARGEGRPDSDVDLVVDMAPGRRGLEYFTLRVDLEEVLGRSVDLIIGNGSGPTQERIQKVIEGAVPL
jgi:predicted nucleotidyltransferase